MKSSVKRLFNQFKPQNYKIFLDPDEKHKTFSGRVVISGFKIGPSSKRLVFHQVGLKITGAKVIHLDKSEETEINISRINYYPKADEVRLHFDKALRSGRYSVEMTYKGKITNPMNGMYPSTYSIGKVNGEIYATQFESHHAREVFPCIDEPAAKATFDLTLSTPKGLSVLSNTKVALTSSLEDRQLTTFETTPKMSTYLVAFVYGDLGYKQKETRDGIVVRGYATKDKTEYLEFALDVAVKVLDFYNDYFGIDYPLEKADLVALPDFAAGAMENWGLITFREQALLVDPDNSSLANKQYVALVIAHELAHQWFGNLVTMHWWTDLWLNEGFASWMEYFAVDKIFPEWKMWLQFAIDEQQQALILDGLENTHPVEVTVKHPDEIRTIFDAISYSKGASMLQMLHQFVGAQDFKAGIRYYLEKHSYGNTDTVDLWSAIEEVSDKPVKEFMHKWTTSSGYPVLQVDITEKETTINQERFFINPSHKREDSTIWPVALMANNEGLEDLMTTRHKIYKTGGSRLKLNVGQAGFYRVVYNPTHIELLGSSIARGHIGTVDRLGILSDAFETSKAGMSDTTEALHFLGFFSDEDSYVVWDVISSSIGNLRLVMDDEQLREDMKPYIRNLVSKQLLRLGINRKKSDSHFDQLLRPTILSMAAGADEPKIIKYCLDKFKQIETVNEVRPDLKVVTSRKSLNRGILDPDLRGTVFGTVARLGGQKEFDKLLKLHNDSTMSEQRTVLTAALTSFKQPAIIKQALALINSEFVRPQDISYWIAYSFMNRFSKELTWEWLEKNWGWLEDTLGTDLAFYRMPVYAARAFSNIEFKKRYIEFFKPRITPSLERSYKQGLEIISYHSEWRERSLKEVQLFFKQNTQSL